MKPNSRQELPQFDDLGTLGPKLAEVCAAVASDIALVIDSDGIICNVSTRDAAGPFSAADWVGRRWSDTVTVEARPKIEKLLSEARNKGLSRRREINHPNEGGPDTPVNYAAMRLGSTNTFLAAGRDLSGIAAIQQSFLAHQQALEHDYWQHRHHEARYRLLFQVATDAVMVVDASTLKIIEANDASTLVFDLPLEVLIGQDIATAVKKLYRPAVHELMITARASGQPAEIRVPLAKRTTQIALSATPFRSPGGLQLLVRARTADSSSIASSQGKSLLDYVQRSPDAVVVTDSNGRVVAANQAFQSMIHSEHATTIEGTPLAQLLGCDESALGALLKSVRSQAIATATPLSKNGLGQPTYEVSGVLLDSEDQEYLGFTIRSAAAKTSIGNGDPGAAVLPGDLTDPLTSKIRALGQELGNQNMDSLVSSATRAIEAHLMDLALSRCGSDTHKAAQLLGIGEATIRAHLAQRGDASGQHGPDRGP